MPGPSAEHSRPVLFTLNFHLLDHIVEDLRRFGMPSGFETSLSEHHIVHIKKSYHRTSRRSKSIIQETIKVHSHSGKVRTWAG